MQTNRQDQSYVLKDLIRRYPHRLPVFTIGYRPHKTYWMATPPPRQEVCLSFIFKGKGTFIVNRQPVVIHPPAAIFSEPTADVQYGPNLVWEELIINYARELSGELYRQYPPLQRQCIWTIKNKVCFNQVFDLLWDGLNRKKDAGWADRVDRLCDWLIDESLTDCQTELLQNATHAMIQAIVQQLNKTFAQEPDFAALARTHGLSLSNFRRLWYRHIGIAPTRYVLNLRLQEACRLLRQTTLRIHEIADRTGFHDALYFSRRFHQFTGQTATQFRATMYKSAQP